MAQDEVGDSAGGIDDRGAREDMRAMVEKGALDADQGGALNEVRVGKEKDGLARDRAKKREGEPDSLSCKAEM